MNAPSKTLVYFRRSNGRWSQTYILESLLNFTPQNPGDAEIIAERIAPRLQHANSSVVLTTTKVILYLTNYMSKQDDIATLCKKLSPPLGIQYVTVLPAYCLSNVTV